MLLRQALRDAEPAAQNFLRSALLCQWRALRFPNICQPLLILIFVPLILLFKSLVNYNYGFNLFAHKVGNVIDKSSPPTQRTTTSRVAALSPSLLRPEV